MTDSLSFVAARKAIFTHAASNPRKALRAWLLLGTIAVGIPALAAPAIAQQAPVESAGSEVKPAAQTQDGVDEIIVTAGRRSESLQRVPIAASVVGGEDLARSGIARANDLVLKVPALSVQDGGYGSKVNIRGVGQQTANQSGSSGVASYSDGFFIPHDTTAVETYLDVEQIEVLRGPQGTLVGQNSTGGAIFVNSVRPKLGETNGFVRADVGNFGYKRFDAALNVPLSDTLAIRMAGMAGHRDSFYENIAVAGNPDPVLHPGNRDEFGFRLGLKWEPSDTLDVYLKYEHFRRTGDGYAAKPFSELAGGANAVDRRLTDPFVISYGSPTADRNSLTRVSAEINWNVSDAILLRSLTGYQRTKSSSLYDIDYSYAGTGGGPQRISDTAFSQELNLISQGDGPFTWIVGGYFLDDKNPLRIDYNLGGAPSRGLKSSVNLSEHSYALFGQATYSASDAVQFQLGVRANHDRKVVDGEQTASVGGVPTLTIPFGATLKTTEFTGKAAINFFLSKDTMLYASISRGFKPGLVNTNDPIANLTAKPETVMSYEAGLKSSVPGLIRLSGAGFYYDYSHVQTNSYSPTAFLGSIQVNLPKAAVYGAELQADTKIGGLTLNGSVSYVHSELKNAMLIDPRAPLAGRQDLSGRPLPYAPSWTVSAGAAYAHDIDNGTLNLGLNYSYNSQQSVYPFLFKPLDIIPARSLFDANVGVALHNGLSIEAYVQNIFDKTYIAGNLAGNALFGAPRQYGIRVGLQF